MKTFKIVSFGLALFFSAAPLLAGTITNEGDTPVQVSGKSVSGVMGGGTILPGQTSPMRQKFLWLSHVPSGPAKEVRIKIVEDDGTTGYITSFGGTYTCSASANQPARTLEEKPASTLREGYVTNKSNVTIYVTTVRRGGGQKMRAAIPSQTVSIPEDTVEVRTEPLNSSFSDLIIEILVVMPDGKSQLIRSPKGLVRLREG